MINEYTKKMKPTLSAERKPRNREQARAVRILFMSGLIVLVLFAFVWMRLHYQSRTEELNRQAVQLDIQIEKDRLVIDNLRNRKEQLCSWSNVSRKIAVYKMPLQQRKPSQVTYLKRFRTPDADAVAQTAPAEKTDNSKQTVAAAEKYTYHSLY